MHHVLTFSDGKTQTFVHWAFPVDILVREPKMMLGILSYHVCLRMRAKKRDFKPTHYYLFCSVSWRISLTLFPSASALSDFIENIIFPTHSGKSFSLWSSLDVFWPQEHLWGWLYKNSCTFIRVTQHKFWPQNIQIYSFNRFIECDSYHWELFQVQLSAEIYIRDESSTESSLMLSHASKES